MIAFNITLAILFVLTLNTFHQVRSKCGLEELCKSSPCEKVHKISQSDLDIYESGQKLSSLAGTFTWLDKEEQYGKEYCPDQTLLEEDKVFCARRFEDSEEQMYCTSRKNELKRMCGKGELCMFPCKGNQDWNRVLELESIPVEFKNFTLHNWDAFLKRAGKRYCISGTCIRNIQTSIENDNLEYTCTGDYKKCSNGQMCQLPCKTPPPQVLPDIEFPMFLWLGKKPKNQNVLNEFWADYLAAMGKRYCVSGKCVRRADDDNTLICTSNNEILLPLRIFIISSLLQSIINYL